MYDDVLALLTPGKWHQSTWIIDYFSINLKYISYMFSYMIIYIIHIYTFIMIYIITYIHISIYNTNTSMYIQAIYINIWHVDKKSEKKFCWGRSELKNVWAKKWDMFHWEEKNKISWEKNWEKESLVERDILYWEERGKFLLYFQYNKKWQKYPVFFSPFIPPFLSTKIFLAFLLDVS